LCELLLTTPWKYSRNNQYSHRNLKVATLEAASSHHSNDCSRGISKWQSSSDRADGIALARLQCSASSSDGGWAKEQEETENNQ